jgi:hypothetical protein
MKPPNAGKGRKKGSKNKHPVAFREAVVQAFYLLGGVDGLVEWGSHNRTEFYRIASRLIPTELAPPAATDGQRVTKVTFEYVTDHATN